MAKTKQAPLPWTLTQNSWQYTTIYAADGAPICRLDLEDWSVTEDNQDLLEKVQSQIAERIVKAVNNHDALLKALEAIEFRGHQGKCPLCTGWDMSPSGETPGKHTKDCLVGLALGRVGGSR